MLYLPGSSVFKARKQAGDIQNCEGVQGKELRVGYKREDDVDNGFGFARVDEYKVELQKASLLRLLLSQSRVVYLGKFRIGQYRPVSE